MSNTVEPDTFFQSLDAQDPNRWLLVSRVVTTARNQTLVECFVYVPATSTKKGQRAPTAPVYTALGRTAKIPLARMQSRKLYIPVEKPFIIRRDDGHEVAYS